LGDFSSSISLLSVNALDSSSKVELPMQIFWFLANYHGDGMFGGMVPYGIDVVN
jgi:hypothetical protein